MVETWTEDYHCASVSRDSRYIGCLCEDLIQLSDGDNEFKQFKLSMFFVCINVKLM